MGPERFAGYSRKLIVTPIENSFLYIVPLYLQAPVRTFRN